MFIAVWPNDPSPTVLNDNSLGVHVRSYAQAWMEGSSAFTGFRVWRWVGDGQTEPLTIRRLTTGDAERSTWAATAADGRAYGVVTLASAPVGGA